MSWLSTSPPPPPPSPLLWSTRRQASTLELPTLMKTPKKSSETPHFLETLWMPQCLGTSGMDLPKQSKNGFPFPPHDSLLLSEKCVSWRYVERSKEEKGREFQVTYISHLLAKAPLFRDWMTNSSIVGEGNTVDGSAPFDFVLAASGIHDMGHMYSVLEFEQGISEDLNLEEKKEDSIYSSLFISCRFHSPQKISWCLLSWKWWGILGTSPLPARGQPMFFRGKANLSLKDVIQEEKLSTPWPESKVLSLQHQFHSSMP